MKDYGWLRVKHLKALIKQWADKGLTDESIVLVYSDKLGEASGMLGICCVEASDGSIGLMLAPGTCHDEIESGRDIKGPGSGSTRRPPDA